MSTILATGIATGVSREPSFVLGSLVGLGAGASQQVAWLNRGLHDGDALLVVPSYYAFSILFQIIGGGVLFDEFGQMTVGSILGFAVSLAVTLLGVHELALRSVGEDEHAPGVDHRRSPGPAKDHKHCAPKPCPEANLDLIFQANQRPGKTLLQLGHYRPRYSRFLPNLCIPSWRLLSWVAECNTFIVSNPS